MIERLWNPMKYISKDEFEENKSHVEIELDKEEENLSTVLIERLIRPRECIEVDLEKKCHRRHINNSINGHLTWKKYLATLT